MLPAASSETGDFPSVGAIVGGRYRLDSLLGAGAAANVFEAFDTQLGGVVALKALSLLGAWNSEILARFKREVLVTTAISNPHVVRVVDAGWDSSFGIYLVMERLRGCDLRQRLSAHGAMAPRDALRMASEAARGLAAAHAVGAVHRDLKPSNVFLAETEGADSACPPRVKIVDFGIAKVFGGLALGESFLTRPGAAIGTPQYMAPEQIKSPEQVTPATDVYALGAVLFEALSGEPVIRAGRSYAQMLVDVVTPPMPRLRARWPAASAPLDDLVATMMHPDPSQRGPSMGHLADLLERLAR